MAAAAFEPEPSKIDTAKLAAAINTRLDTPVTAAWSNPSPNPSPTLNPSPKPDPDPNPDPYPDPLTLTLTLTLTLIR